MKACRIAIIVLVASMGLGSKHGLKGENEIVRLRLERDRDCARLHLHLAEWCRKQGLHRDAHRHFQAALRFDRWNAQTRAACEAEIPPDSARDPQRAQASLQRREKSLTSGLMKIWCRHASRMARVGRKEEVPWAWAQALALQPDHRLLRRRLGKSADSYLHFVRLANLLPVDDSRLPRSQFGDEGPRTADSILRDRMPLAMSRIEERLGLRVKESERFPIILLTGNRSPNHMASAISGNENFLEIFTRNWTYRKRLELMEKTVDHELVHMLQILRMGTRTFQAVPRWFREGIAVYGAQEGAAKLKWALEETGGRIDPILNGLEPGKSSQKNPSDYTEGWLAVKYLEQTLGTQGFRIFLDQLHAGESSLPELILGKTGKTLDLFEKGVHDFARAHFRSLLQEP
jgi:hypothetical protein